MSVNGEGNKAGYLSVFIRFAGCNLSCEYCDTKWANLDTTKYHLMSADEIYKYIKKTGIFNVTLTGGEPLIQPNIMMLLHTLSNDHTLNIEVETSGSVDITPFADIDNPPSFTVDYKLGSSNMESKMFLDNYKYLTSKDSVKFVVGTMDDLMKATSVIKNYNLINKCNIYISPVYGEIEMKNIVDFMKIRKLNGVKLQPQLHKYIWEPNLRGV